MEKLLHERLREWATSDEPNYRPLQELGIIHGWSYGRMEGSEFLNKLADEIERYYIPRPRFEDGEPMVIKDDCQCNGVNWWIEAFNDEDEVLLIRCLGDDAGTTERMWERPANIKRPQPKVLDADGVEIKVGDTVYTLTSDIKMKVLMLDTNFDCEPIIQTEDGRYKPEELTHNEPVLDADGVLINVGDTVWRIEDGLQMSVIAVGEEALKQSCEVLAEIDGKQPYHYNGSELTHKEPVLDADGVPIKVGDTVWSVDGGPKWTISYVCPDEIGVTSDEIMHGTMFCPDSLTHKEPDSLEKLRDDMALDASADGAAISSSRLGVYATRLSALIERGA